MTLVWGLLVQNSNETDGCVELGERWWLGYGVGRFESRRWA